MRQFFVRFLPIILTVCSFAALAIGNLQPTPASTEPSSVPTGAVASDAQSAPVGTQVSVAPTTTLEPRRPITIPISVYILDDDSDELSSTRTAEQLEAVYERAGQIWGQADIVLEVQTVRRVTVPSRHLQTLAAGDFRNFFAGAGTEFEVPEPSLLNGFYAQSIGGPNGITPLGSRTFFVTDKPSVHHERVTSHEIGHLFGLHHTLTDTGRLMYPGTNGIQLTDEEIIVARYAARGLLAGVR